ncbi:ribonuclease E inhibitor RraB [Acinetobacter sp. B51(2017)]|uniref:ribonuclease E inhibitor RraB n=1 Tax=Acinetobacter sp. B51(2017) TaxID=2060938 RepID=UPI000F07ECE7|nr:ribonuclease E inhibitor RraB [Acinetobacter sp. B51(2017)]
MYRDYQKFPDDENGNLLWQMYEDGDDLSEVHEIEFSLSFNEQAKAERAALHLLREEQKIHLFLDQQLQPAEWRLTLFIDMSPNYEEIVDLEAWLGQIAHDFEGEYDGWGCMAYVFDDEIDGTS